MRRASHTVHLWLVVMWGWPQREHIRENPLFVLVYGAFYKEKHVNETAVTFLDKSIKCFLSWLIWLMAPLSNNVIRMRLLLACISHVLCKDLSSYIVTRKCSFNGYFWILSYYVLQQVKMGVLINGNQLFDCWCLKCLMFSSYCSHFMCFGLYTKKT